MATKDNYVSKHVATLRIIFGIVWAIDASFKWSPSFSGGFLDQIKSAADGQPAWLGPWFHFWIQLIGSHVWLFATMTAIIESLIAIALLFGIARQITYLAAAIFSLMIWSVPEGFGGPYSATSTDIGTGIIYAVVFFSLYGLERMATPPRWALDNYISKRVPWWAVVASPRPVK